MGNRQRRLPSFGDWTPPSIPAPVPSARRDDFGGLAPEDATRRLVGVLEARGAHRPITLANKRSALTRVLRAFGERGKDLANVGRGDVAAYHAYLKDLARRGLYSEDTCSNLARNWNSTLRAVFWFREKPGDGLIMKGFQQHAKKVRLTEAEFAALHGALLHHGFRWHHTRLAFEAYLEIAWCAGPRIGSLVEGRLEVRDVDLRLGVIMLRHMKNAAYLPRDEDHVVVLSPKAIMAVRRWIDYLAALPVYDGPGTALFVAPNGKPLTAQWINRTLNELALSVGIKKRVTTHVLRKSAGTIMGAKNPKLAQRQLGISEEIFNRHYNFPGLDERLARRDILPGAGVVEPAPRRPNAGPEDGNARWEPAGYA